MVRDERLAEPDAEAVARAARAATGREVASVEPISKGINATYRVAFADGDLAVLKAATFNTAAELRPEPRLLRRLAREATIPVPEVLAIVEDGGPLGTFHFLLDYCDGRLVGDLGRLSVAEQERLVRATGRHLGRLHEHRLLDTCGPLRVTDPAGDRTPEFTTESEHESWGAVFASLADHPVSLFERVQCGDDPGRFVDLVPDVVAAFEGVESAIAEPETPVVLHGDFRHDNMVLAPPDEEGPLVRAVLDFGDPYVGDYRFDLAFAEDAMLRVQFPTSDRADHLAELLRETYADERGIDSAEIATESYAYYLLVQRARWMAVAMKWDEYDDPDAVERAYRSFVREQLDEIG